MGHGQNRSSQPTVTTAAKRNTSPHTALTIVCLSDSIYENCPEASLRKEDQEVITPEMPYMAQLDIFPPVDEKEESKNSLE